LVAPLWLGVTIKLAGFGNSALPTVDRVGEEQALTTESREVSGVKKTLKRVAVVKAFSVPVGEPLTSLHFDSYGSFAQDSVTEYNLYYLHMRHSRNGTSTM